MARSEKCLKYVKHIFLITVISILVSHSQKRRISYTKIERYVPDIRHILIWSPISGLHDTGQKHFIDRRCRYINCYITHNKTLFNDTRIFDAILFNLQDVAKGTQILPKKRSLEQIFIFAANDSAENYPVCNPIYDDFFNWTWTYRSDSTVSYRFFSIFNLDNDELGTHFDWLPNMIPIDESMIREMNSKNKAVAWFVDICKTRSKREDFVRNLQKELANYNLTVDIYGKCGPYKCKRKSMAPCYWKLRKFYYFYLALEDSVSPDFVTGEVLHGYRSNTVPIVFGGAHYDYYLPPNSYIDGRQLGEKTVAERVYQAITNPSDYYNFFRWKNHYGIRESPVLDACTLCQKLNDPRYFRNRVSYTLFRKWWNYNFEQRCTDNNKLMFVL